VQDLDLLYEEVMNMKSGGGPRPVIWLAGDSSLDNKSWFDCLPDTNCKRDTSTIFQL